MLVVTQSEINEAVLLGKKAVYSLANEIAIEKKYGGNTDCCYKRLKLIYTLLQPLLCVKTGLASYTFSSLGTPGGNYQLYVNNELLFSYVAPAANNTAVDNAIAYANSQEAGYTFESAVIPGQDVKGVKMIGTCENFVIKRIDDKDTAVILNSSGGYCLDCLNNDTVKKLIGKIRAFCTTKDEN